MKQIFCKCLTELRLRQRISAVTLSEVLRLRIEQLLAAKGMSPEDLSVAVRKSPKWATGFLRGSGQDALPLDSIEDVARVLGVQPIELLDERALQPIAGLGSDDLAIARAFQGQTNQETKAAVRLLLGLAKSPNRPRVSRDRSRVAPKEPEANDFRQSTDARKGRTRDAG